MRNSTARNIRDFITDVPTVPKKMAQVERQLYRTMKRVYNKTPSNQKDSFFRSLSFTMAKLRAEMKKTASAPTNSGILKRVDNGPIQSI